MYVVLYTYVGVFNEIITIIIAKKIIFLSPIPLSRNTKLRLHYSQVSHFLDSLSTYNRAVKLCTAALLHTIDVYVWMLKLACTYCIRKQQNGVGMALNEATLPLILHRKVKLLSMYLWEHHVKFLYLVSLLFRPVPFLLIFSFLMYFNTTSDSWYGYNIDHWIESLLYTFTHGLACCLNTMTLGKGTTLYIPTLLL